MMTSIRSDNAPVTEIIRLHIFWISEIVEDEPVIFDVEFLLFDDELSEKTQRISHDRFEFVLLTRKRRATSRCRTSEGGNRRLTIIGRYRTSNLISIGALQSSSKLNHWASVLDVYHVECIWSILIGENHHEKRSARWVDDEMLVGNFLCALIRVFEQYWTVHVLQMRKRTISVEDQESDECCSSKVNNIQWSGVGDSSRLSVCSRRLRRKKRGEKRRPPIRTHIHRVDCDERKWICSLFSSSSPTHARIHIHVYIDVVV
jgi:hypothetical protein